MIAIEKNIKELLNSPIYQMTCSSMENSHSDFWCWMFNKFGIECLTLFDIKYQEGDSIKSIKREYRHFDLYIETNFNHIVIIENKMKSAFYKEQIIKYSNKISNIQSNKIDLRVITYFEKLKEEDIQITPNDEGYFENILQWKPLTYMDLSNNFEKFNSDNLFVREYKKVLKNLTEINELMKQCSKEYENGENKIISELHNIRLDDIYKKFKASDLRNYLEENIKIDGLKFNFYYQSGNGATSISFDKDNIEYVLTLQGKYYRREANSNDEEHNPILKKWLSLSEDRSNMGELKSEYKASHMRKKHDLNVFNKNTDNAFYYRCFCINEYFSDLSYKTILSKIKSDLDIVFKNK